MRLLVDVQRLSNANYCAFLYWCDTAIKSLGAACLLVYGAHSAIAEDRVWKDVTGKFHALATFVEHRKDEVVLRRQEDGKIIVVPIGKLCDADKAFVKELTGSSTAKAPANNKQVEELIRGIAELDREAAEVARANMNFYTIRERMYEAEKKIIEIIRSLPPDVARGVLSLLAAADAQLTNVGTANQGPFDYSKSRAIAALYAGEVRAIAASSYHLKYLILPEISRLNANTKKGLVTVADEIIAKSRVPEKERPSRETWILVTAAYELLYNCDASRTDEAKSGLLKWVCHAADDDVLWNTEGKYVASQLFTMAPETKSTVEKVLAARAAAERRRLDEFIAEQERKKRGNTPNAVRVDELDLLNFPERHVGKTIRLTSCVIDDSSTWQRLRERKCFVLGVEAGKKTSSPSITANELAFLIDEETAREMRVEKSRDICEIFFKVEEETIGSETGYVAWITLAYVVPREQARKVLEDLTFGGGGGFALLKAQFPDDGDLFHQVYLRAGAKEFRATRK